MHIRKFLKIEKSDLFNLHNKTRKKDRFSKQNCSKHTFISAINIQLKLLMHEKAKKYINFLSFFYRFSWARVIQKYVISVEFLGIST